MLGIRYYDRQDYARAKEYFEKAALNGNADAQSSLGYIYARGRGVELDYVKAREWYEKAVAQGLAYTQTYLGIMYTKSIGVEQDYSKAREWCEKVADNGHEGAQKKLDELNRRGRRSE